MPESRRDRLRNIRHRIGTLHPGQIAIVSLVGVLGIVLLVHARQHAALEIRRYETQAAAIRDSIDSLNSEIFKAWMVLSTYPRPSLDRARFSEWAYGRIVNLDTLMLRRKVDLDESLVHAAISSSEAAASRRTLLALVIAAVAGLALSVLWVWFGGRQQASAN
jgi:hypothetical protein